MEKKQYIQPEIEVIVHQYLCDEENLNTNSIEGGMDADARGFNFDSSEDTQENPFKKYNPWE